MEGQKVRQSFNKVIFINFGNRPGGVVTWRWSGESSMTLSNQSFSDNDILDYCYIIREKESK